jgi:alcohol dehydrogenase class IV
MEVESSAAPPPRRPEQRDDPFSRIFSGFPEEPAVTTSLLLPRIVTIGAGVREQLPTVLAQLDISHPLIVTDRSLIEHRVLDDSLALLTTNGIPFAVFDAVAPDPTTDHVDALCRTFAGDTFDGLVAIGGGSPIDAAKAAGILKTYPGKTLRELKTPFIVAESRVPLVCLPTTAGTGSEVTRFAVITDVHTGEKMLITGRGCVPAAALVDVELSMSMPARVAADTGLDALTHGVEAYLSHRHNDHADTLAVSGVRRVLLNLPIVWSDPGNVDARTQMTLAATHAGLAFSASSVALVHGMSRAIGALFHVPHGMANAMLLDAVLRWTRPHALIRLASLARETGVADRAQTDDAAADALLQRIASLVDAMAVPTPREFGIALEQWTQAIPTMTRQALASGSPANNPGDPTDADISNLYAQIWN